jgi:hypothetical protein
VQEGAPDRIADLLEEAVKRILELEATITEISKDTVGRDRYQP